MLWDVFICVSWGALWKGHFSSLGNKLCDPRQTVISGGTVQFSPAPKAPTGLSGAPSRALAIEWDVKLKAGITTSLATGATAHFTL